MGKMNPISTNFDITCIKSSDCIFNISPFNFCVDIFLCLKWLGVVVFFYNYYVLN